MGPKLAEDCGQEEGLGVIMQEEIPVEADLHAAGEGALQIKLVRDRAKCSTYVLLIILV